MTAATPTSDDARVRALEALGVSGTIAEERFDRITRLTQQLFDVPMVGITLIDQSTQWIKSSLGLDVSSTPRRLALCDHAIRQAGSTVVEDLGADARFADHPSVVGPDGVRFYAGHPLEAADGLRVGTLCVADTRPRRFSATELILLQELAAWAESELTRSAELTRAAEVQRGLLPRRRYAVPDYELAGMCLPSRAVGGDFIDWYYGTGEDVVLTLGDVMGKGIGAAITAASTRAAMRTAGWSASPAAAVQQAAVSLDDELQRTGTLVTLLQCRLRPRTGLLTWADAGHGLLLILRADGAVEHSASNDLPVGIDAGSTWTDQQTVLRPGDTVVGFSDGVLDLYDGTLGAVDEVVRVTRELGDPAAVIGHFTALADRSHLPDDVTIVVGRRLAGPAGP